MVGLSIGAAGAGSSRSNTLAAWALLIICLSGAITLWHFQALQLEEAERREIEQLGANLDRVLMRRIDAYLDGLRACRGLFAASKSVERDEWRAFVLGMKLADRYPGVRAMNFVRSVPAAGKAAFVERVRQDASITSGGYPGFDIHPGGERDSYQVIEYIEPLEPNLQYLGLDLGSDPEAAAVLMRACDTGKAGVSGCYAAPGAASGRRKEFLLVLPIYQNGRPSSTAEERRQALDGFVTQHFIVDEFFSSVFLECLPMNTRLSVRDVSDPGAVWPLWSHSTRPRGTAGASGRPHASTTRVAVTGRRWEIRLEALPDFAAAKRTIPLLILSAGILISFLVFAFAWSLGTGRARALALAERMTSELRRSESLTRTIIDTALDAVITIDPEGRITRWSPQAEEIFGWTAEDASGKSLAETIIPPSSWEAHARGLQRFIETGESSILGNRIEVIARRRDGSELPAELAVAAIQSEGTWTFSAFVRDITARKRVEAQLKEALAEAQAAVSARSNFLATMSHEIRTPLNAVIGMTGLLIDTDLDPEQREFADTVRSAGEGLLAIVNDILDFSKIEAGKFELEMGEFDLPEAVEDAAEIFCWLAEEKGIELCCSIGWDVPSRLRGDSSRLRQILLNLIGNAVKFTMRGEVIVRCRLDRLLDGAVLIRFEVEDTGIGISPELQARLFQPFSQADSSTTRKFGGTGLGLAISKRLSDLMGGGIGVKSAPGMGSTFWFTARLERAGGDPQAGSAPAELRGPIAGRRALVVDDSATQRRIISRYLAALGLECADAIGAAEALDRLETARAAGKPPDLLVIDLKMPGQDGLALIQAVKDRPELRGIPLILLTPRGHPAAAEARAAGVDAVLGKPVRIGELREASFQLLAGKQQAPLRSPAASPGVPGDRAQVRGRILVAEDNPVNQKVAVRLLERLSFRADVVGSGREAVEAAIRIRYDAVLMDCQMPELDGLEAAAEIRRREGAGRRVPIIAVTANVMNGEAEKCREAGMDDYLAKPIRLEALESMLRQWKIGEPAAV